MCVFSDGYDEADSEEIHAPGQYLRYINSQRRLQQGTTNP